MRVKSPTGVRTVVLVLVLCVSVIRSVSRGETTIPLVPEPVGSGARALGQSAFIAVADDATAASWNPAGLINLEKPEASLVGIWRTITDDRLSSDSDNLWDGDSWSVSEINFMSYARPIPVGKTDMVLSVNYHQVYDLSMEYYHFVREQTGDTTATLGRWDGAISAYSLAGGISMPSVPELAIGASFNWYAGSLLNDYVRSGRNVNWRVRNNNPQEPSTVSETLSDLRAYNFTFGVLWDLYERRENLLTLGLVCHTPFAAKMDQEASIKGNVEPRFNRVDIDFPLSLGAGLNYRFSDRFSTAFDVQWTDWSDFNVAFTGGTSAPSDTVAYRLGGEYLTFLNHSSGSVLAYRGGVFYEPRPAWTETLPVYGFSLGLGWTLPERFSLDFAYQFRWGGTEIGTFDYDIEEHWFIGSVIVYFR